jgi:hypothetical protein
LASEEGEQILRSANESFQVLDELTWEEAENFVDSLRQSGVIVAHSSGEDTVVGASPYVPVFQGRMSVHYSLAAVTLNPEEPAASATTPVVPPPAISLPPIATVPPSLASLFVSQGADGRLFVEATANNGQTELDQAVVQYSTFFVPALRSTEQRKVL